MPCKQLMYDPISYWQVVQPVSKTVFYSLEKNVDFTTLTQICLENKLSDPNDLFIYT